MRGLATRAVGLVAVVALLSLVPGVAAKAALEVHIYSVATGRPVAVIRDGAGLLAFESGLSDPARQIVPLDPGTTWDYRLLSYYNPELTAPSEFWYRAPRERGPGSLCCADASGVPIGTPSPGQPLYVLRSATFDEVMAPYLAGVPGDQDEPLLESRWFWIVIGGGAAVAAFFAVLFASPRRTRTPQP